MFLIKIVALTNVIAFIIGIFYYKSFPKEVKTIFYFVAFGVFTQLYMKMHQHFIMKNTMIIGHFYFPIVFLILTIFYLQVLKGFVKPVYLYVIIIIYESYCLINSLFIQSLFEYPSIEAAIGATIIFLFSIAWFTKIMIEAKIEKLAEEPLVWINSAILIYYTGNFFYFSLYNLIVNASLDVAMLVTKLFVVLNLFFYLIIAIGFLKAKRANTTKALQ